MNALALIQVTVFYVGLKINLEFHMRIVSLLPAATEIICRLGLEDCLVGVSHECDYPSSVKSLPKITESLLEANLTPEQINEAVENSNLTSQPLYKINIDRLNSVRADVVITQRICSVCAVNSSMLDEAISVVELSSMGEFEIIFLDGLDLAGITEDIFKLGEALDVRRDSEQLCSWMRHAYLDNSCIETDAPRVLMLEWPDPPWYGGHWVPEQVACAGGRNLFGIAGQPSRQSTWEDIYSSDPDIIVVCACGFNCDDNYAFGKAFVTSDVIRDKDFLREIDVWAVDANSYFSRPGPRVVEGIELLRSIFEQRGKQINVVDGRRVLHS